MYAHTNWEAYLKVWQPVICESIACICSNRASSDEGNKNSLKHDKKVYRAWKNAQAEAEGYEIIHAGGEGESGTSIHCLSEHKD